MSGEAGFARRAIGAFSAGFARLVFGRDVAADLRADRERLAVELSRRLAELYSLQELTQILSASLRFDSVVAEVARYAMRALDASGAVVLLAPEDGGSFQVVAAKGYLAGSLHEFVDPESGGLLLDAIAHERLEMRAGPAGTQLRLFANATARASVAAPLRAHGVTVGAIAVADKLSGEFTPEDARLLSTAATHAAVVLANARFFELMRRGKEQWEATFDALGEGIAVVDAEGSIRRANDALAALAGEDVRRVVGRSLSSLLFGDADQALPALLTEARTAPPGSGRGGPGMVRRSERLGRMLRIAVAPMHNAGPEATTVVVVEDITDQKRLEGQLIQSEKLAAVGTLVSGVAHELNNPLTSIAGLSELLIEQKAGDDHALEHLRVINDQAERASRIVRNLLSFARKAPVERAPLEVGDIVQRTVLLMGYELRQAGITIETRIPAALPPVLGNRDQLQQVILNLLANAAYVLSRLPGGVPRRISVSVVDVDGSVVIRIADTGPGIAPETAAQIFDPFFTTKPPGEGTGLGLFLSFGIAESHGGTLAVESEPGLGATFIMSLPVVESGAGAGPPAAEPAAPRSGVAARRILVVDHDAVVRRTVSVLFTHEGHRVETVATGDEALALATREEFDLLVTDHRAFAGREPLLQALERVRPGWSARTIVSASGQRVEPASGGGAARLLPKPFNLKELRDAAAAVWGGGGGGTARD